LIKPMPESCRLDQLGRRDDARSPAVAIHLKGSSTRCGKDARRGRRDGGSIVHFSTRCRDQTARDLWVIAATKSAVDGKHDRDPGEGAARVAQHHRGMTRGAGPSQPSVTDGKSPELSEFGWPRCGGGYRWRAARNAAGYRLVVAFSFSVWSPRWRMDKCKGAACQCGHGLIGPASQLRISR